MLTISYVALAFYLFVVCCIGMALGILAAIFVHSPLTITILPEQDGDRHTTIREVA